MASPHNLITRNMIAAKKLFVVGFFLFNLLPLLVASLDQHTLNSNNKLNVQKITPKLSYEIKLHGFLLWASVGFLMPLSILIKRISHIEPSPSKLRIIFYIHAITQVIAVLISAAGGIIAIKYFDNSFSNNHQIIGLIFYGAIWLQTILSILRPKRGSRVRKIWFIFHWLVGIAASLLGVINVFTGLEAYYKRTMEDVRIWKIVFVVELCLVLLVYLLQEKWQYLKKQETTSLAVTKQKRVPSSEAS